MQSIVVPESPEDLSAEIGDKYRRRAQCLPPGTYHPLKPDVYMARQERERALIRWIKTCNLEPVEEKRVLDVGCGMGEGLAQFLRLGFDPSNLAGIDILPERIRTARLRLPGTVDLRVGDVARAGLATECFDVVSQFTVFSSIGALSSQARLAGEMWRAVKPGGGVLWYDFTFNNPRNRDVAGVPVHRIRTLFPDGDVKIWRLTLAPPLSRAVTRFSPHLYTLFNAIPLLRTHVLCWIRKAL